MRKNGPHIPSRFDPEAATELAVELRKEGFSLSQIGARLRKAKLTPQRGGKWYPAQVAKLLQDSEAHDRNAAARRAAEWRAEGMTLKEIGVRLAMEGYQTRDGGIWHPATVRALIHGLESEQRSLTMVQDTLSLGR